MGHKTKGSKTSGRKLAGHRVYKVNVPVIFVQEGEYIVAYCPALDLSSYGLSERDAKDSFDAALKIFLDETEKKGTLERILLDLGWTLRHRPSYQYRLPEMSPQRLRRITKSNPVNVVSETVPIRLACS